MRRTTALWFCPLLLLLLLVPAAAQQQPGVAQAGEAPLYWVDGRPLLRVQLLAGTRRYACHLLLDLARREPLRLHENAAGALRAEAVDLRTGGIELPQLPLRAERITWLEEFTKQHARALEEIPVAGLLGLPAFGEARIELDGPARTLRLGQDQGEARPPAPPRGVVVDLLEDPRRDGLVTALEIAEGQRVRLLVHSGEASSLIAPELATRLGAPHGVLERARVGELELARLGVFFPHAVPKAVQATLGGRMLAQLRLVFDPRAGWLLLEPAEAIAFPHDEAALQRALFAEDRIGPLRTWLEEHPESEFRSEAAHELVHRALAVTPPDPELVLAAARTSIAAAGEERHAEEALKIADELPGPLAHLRRSLLEAGLAHADGAAEPTRIYEIRLELGGLDRRAGDLTSARRHLLSAAFGLPGDGRVQLELGRLHEAQGRLDRARGAYLHALLDTENTGEAGLLHLLALHPRLPEKDRPLPQLLREWTDGRVPAFHPMPRDPEDVPSDPARVVLVELFTGAQCPPCVAADLAVDALAEHFGSRELVAIQWHLPIPAPEPLIAPVSRERARRYGVRGTPTVVVGGAETVSGGGDATAAGELFARLAQLVHAEAAKSRVVTLEAEGRIEDGRIHARASVRPEPGRDLAALRLHVILVEDTLIFPGENGVLFHSQVARARLTEPVGLPVTKAPPTAPIALQAALPELEAELDAAVRAVERDGRFQVRPTQLDPAQLALVLFVEDMAARGGQGEIVQALRVPLAAAEGPR